MRTFLKSDQFVRLKDAEEKHKVRFCEIVFLDEELLSLAVEFYNLYFGYVNQPITREEAISYANLGVRLNADLFKAMRPFDKEKLDYFYQITPFYFFHDILRFMDGYHMEEIREIEEKFKPPFLDFAGGTGGHTIYLAKKGLDVTFFESNFMQLNWMNWLKSKLQLNFSIENDGSKLTKRFETILAKDIAEHVVDPGDLYRYLESLIVDGGKILFTQVPCCGAEEMAPMHFKISGNESDFQYSVEENLKYLGKVGTV